MIREIYFDNASTTKPSETAVRAWNEVMSECWGNPSSIHRNGRKAKQRLEEAREIVADCISCIPNEITFVSSGTEGDNMIVYGVVENLNSVGNTILRSAIEHPGVVEPMKYLKSTGHYKVKEIQVDKNGSVNEQHLIQLLNDNDCSLVSIMWVNNELGSVQNIKKLCEITHSYEVPFMTDSVQAVGKLEVDVKDLGVDYLVASGHKINSTKCAFVYISEDAIVKPFPLLRGGGQEKGARSSTEDVASAWAMACALKENCENMDANIKHIDSLKSYLIQSLQETGISFKLNGDTLGKNQSGIGIVSVQFPWMNGEALLLTLNNDKLDGNCICVSTGSACAASKSSGSYVLKAIGLSDEEISHTVRISFSHTNTFEEIEILVNKLKLIRDNFGIGG